MKRLLFAVLLTSFFTSAQENNYSLEFSGFSGTENPMLYKLRTIPSGNTLLFAGFGLDEFDYSMQLFYGKKLLNGTAWAKEFPIPAQSGFYMYGRYDVDIAPCKLTDGFYVKVLFTDETWAPCVLLFKCSGDGTVLWTRKVNLPVESSIYSENNPLRVSSADEVTFTVSSYDCLGVVTVNSSGAMVYAKRLAFTTSPGAKNPGFCFTPTPDGGFIGSMKNENNPCIFKLDAALHVQWSKEWSIDYYGHPKSILKLLSGKYAVCGSVLDEVGDGTSFVAVIGEAGTVEKYYHVPMAVTEFSWVGTPLEMCERADGKLILYNEYGSFTVVDLVTETAELRSFISSSGSPQVYLTNESDISVARSDMYNHRVFVTEGFNPFTANCMPTQGEPLSLTEVSVSPADVFTNTLLITNYGVSFDAYTLSAKNISVTLTPGCNAIAELEQQPATLFTLAPNPVLSGQLVSVTLDKTVEGGTLLLTDLAGRTLFTESISGLVNAFILPGSVSTGMYVVSLMNENGEVLRSERLVVE